MTEKKTQFDGKPIPRELWGKDHLSTLLYIEDCLVNGSGNGYAAPVAARMRSNPNCPRRGHAGSVPPCNSTKEYPTRLKNGVEVFGHDDWSCLEDMETEGLLIWEGTGLQPLISLTDYGWLFASKLRRHYATGQRRPLTFVQPDPSKEVKS